VPEAHEHALGDGPVAREGVDEPVDAELRAVAGDDVTLELAVDRPAVALDLGEGRRVRPPARLRLEDDAIELPHVLRELEEGDLRVVALGRLGAQVVDRHRRGRDEAGTEQGEPDAEVAPEDALHDAQHGPVIGARLLVPQSGARRPQRPRVARSCEPATRGGLVSDDKDPTDGAAEKERRLREHEREARERDSDEESPEAEAGDAAADRPAPPGPEAQQPRG
jgi:hypothetical protein